MIPYRPLSYLFIRPGYPSPNLTMPNTHWNSDWHSKKQGNKTSSLNQTNLWAFFLSIHTKANNTRIAFITTSFSFLSGHKILFVIVFFFVLHFYNLCFAFLKKTISKKPAVFKTANKSKSFWVWLQIVTYPEMSLRKMKARFKNDGSDLYTLA